MVIRSERVEEDLVWVPFFFFFFCVTGFLIFNHLASKIGGNRGSIGVISSNSFVAY